MTEIKKELKGDNIGVKAVAISKLTYVSCYIGGWEELVIWHILYLTPLAPDDGLWHFMGGFQHDRGHEFNQVYLQGKADKIPRWPSNNHVYLH